MCPAFYKIHINCKIKTHRNICHKNMYCDINKTILKLRNIAFSDDNGYYNNTVKVVSRSRRSQNAWTSSPFKARLN